MKKFKCIDIMRKLVNVIFYSSIVLLTAACAKEIDGPAASTETYSATITASVDGAATKTVLNFAEKKSYWFGNENISVLGADGKGYKFSADLSEKALTADFKYSGDEAFAQTEVLAVYPEAIYDWDLEEKTVYDVNIPVAQHPTAESFAPGAVPAVAYTEDIAGGLSFRNIPALIMFSTNEVNAYKITFKGKNGEKVAGKFDVTYGNTLGVVPADDNNVTSATLGAHTLEKGKPYYLAVAPQTYQEGFVIELNDTKVYEYKSSKTLESNKIYNIGEINIPVMEEWYLCGSMTDEWASQIEMTRGDDGWYVAEDITIFTGDDSFKFKQGEAGTWPREFGSSEYNKKYDKGAEFSVVDSGGNNILVKENGIYDVMFNPETKKAKLVYKGAITAPIRIYADNKMGWQSVNVHLWEEKGESDIKINDWPGAALTKDNVSGLWYYDVDVKHHGKYLGYIFSNNGNNQLEAKYITLTKKGFTEELSNQKCRIKVKVNKSIDWYSKHIYAFYGESETKLNGDWPGTNMDYHGEEGNYYVYRYEYPSSMNGVTINYIINNGYGGGSNQTNTLSVKLSKDQEVTVTIESSHIQK